jgi:imidazolonepropionase-like amidohydrolase
VRPGYDADIVIWDSHPLLVGSTPLQVYIDGKATLDDKRVKESLSNVTPSSYQRTMIPQQRKVLDAQTKAGLCACIEKPEARIAFTGITHSFLALLNLSATKGENLTLVMENGKIICLGSYEECLATIHATETAINLTNGHVLPGLTAFSANLGLTEIVFEDGTGDGAVSKKTDVLDPDNLVYAKYGVHLEGRAFGRARIAGITKAVTAPVSDLETPGFVGGVSVGIKTSGDRNILNGGIFKDDVALHFVVGQGARGMIPSFLSFLSHFCRA